jgi:hypothetical protein
MPGDSGVTCLTRVLFTYDIRTRGCGRIGRPVFPAPSWGEGYWHNPGVTRRGNADVYLGAITSQQVAMTVLKFLAV